MTTQRKDQDQDQDQAGKGKGKRKDAGDRADSRDGAGALSSYFQKYNLRPGDGKAKTGKQRPIAWKDFLRVLHPWGKDGREEFLETRLIRAPANIERMGRRAPAVEYFPDSKALLARLPTICKTAKEDALEVFIGCASRRRRKGGKDDLARAFVLWADVDFKDTPEVEARRLLGEGCDLAGIPPSMVVHTGHGLHPYWRLLEPFALDTPDKIQQFEDLLERVRHFVRGDDVDNADRIMRIAGTANRKDPTDVRYANIEVFELGRTYTLDAFQALPDPGKTSTKTEPGSTSTTAKGGTKGAKRTAGEREPWLFRQARSQYLRGVPENACALCLIDADKTEHDPPKGEDFIREKVGEVYARKGGGTPLPKATEELAEVANYRMETGVDKNGDPKEYTVAQSIHEIRKQLFGATGEWPRRVGPLLFHDDAGTVRFLEKHEDLTAWMQERSALSWRGGSDVSGRSLVRRGEFASHLRAKVQDYKAVEELPHEPRLEAHYYAWNPPEGYEPTGEHLAELLDFFDNPATPQDAVLIRAMFCTPVWGGSPGRRPAFVILADDRGFGKTSLAGAVADLCGGPVDLEANDRAEGRLVSRLLSPAALPKRVVRMDNIKGVAESALVESLITSRVISGYRLYHGDASRPNTLTFIVTGNALALSRDLAERAYIIRLQRPTFRAGWEAKLGAFLEAKRDYIIADIGAALRGAKAEYTLEDRHAEWNAGVLARMTPDPDPVLRLNAERRGECDEDISDAGIIEAALDAAADEIVRGQTEAFRAAGDDSEGPGSVFLTSSRVADILAKALREPNLSTRAVRLRVEEHIAGGRLPRVKPTRTRTARGYYIDAGGA